jgi:hypothetical protein
VEQRVRDIRCGLADASCLADRETYPLARRG